MIRKAIVSLACATSVLAPLCTTMVVDASAAPRASASVFARAAALTAPVASAMTTVSGPYTDPTTQIGLQWTPLSGVSLKGYRFGYTTTDAAEPDKTWTSSILSPSSSPRPFVFTTLVPGVKYNVFVEAVSTTGQTARTTVTRTTAQPLPSGPSSLSVTNLTTTRMTINWQQPASSGTSAIDGYQVGWGTWESAMLPGTARSMDLTNFVADTEYTLRVRAHNKSGYGAWTTHTVRTLKAAPTPVPTPTPTPTPTPAPSPAPTTGSSLLGLPKRVTAVYWSSWNAQIPITQLPTSYNLMYLFAAPRGATEGSVTWNAASPTSAQIDTVRARGQRVILSTGGAGQGISFHSRYVSQNFVNSIVGINQKFGGTLSNPKIDGVDFNTFEADAYPNTTEYLWMFGELKRLFGRDFIITSPPAPWKSQDKAMIKQALAQGLMDYAAPQYYDGPGLADPNYITSSARDWINNVAGGQASKIAIGFGMENLPNYSTPAQIQSAWDAIEREFPAVRGAFLWQHRTDSDRGWTYANTINPRVAD